MKKTFVFTFISLLALSSAISCSNKKTYLSETTIKALASAELDALEPDEFTDCELLDVGLENKVYRVGGSDQEMAYISIMLDAVTGEVINSESESLRSGNYGLPKEHLTLDEVKEVIYQENPGISDLNIYSCYFDIDDDENEENPCYYATIFTTDGIRELTIDGVDGEILEDNFKDDGLVDEFEEEFHDYLPQNRFKQENGQRPVWLLAHHCNNNHYRDGQMKPGDERDAYRGIEAGCNGVEIDLSHRSSDNSIILRHIPELVSIAETLDQFLRLPEVSDDRMTMILYDIKDYKYINQIVDVTHAFYKESKNQNVHFIYSINCLSKLAVKGYSDPYKRYRDLVDVLWPNEALAIDYENNQDSVQNMFTDIKFNRGVFGNGIFSGRARGNIERSCKAAINIRDNSQNPYRFSAVESWTVGRLYNKKWLFYESVGLAERIDWGCNIVLLDGFKGLNYLTYDTFYGRELFIINPHVRLATKDDYPFGTKE